MRRRSIDQGDPKQYPPAELDFDEFMLLWSKDITNIARRYRSYFRYADGWEVELGDAEQELRVVMYKAWLQWKPGKGQYGKLMWSMWRNLLSDQVRKLNSAKRSAAIVSLSTEWDEPDQFDMAELLITGVGAVGEEACMLRDVLSGEYTERELKDRYGEQQYLNNLARWRGVVLSGGVGKVRTRRDYVLFKQGRNAAARTIKHSRKG